MIQEIAMKRLEWIDRYKDIQKDIYRERGGLV